MVLLPGTWTGIDAQTRSCALPRSPQSVYTSVMGAGMTPGGGCFSPRISAALFACAVSLHRLARAAVDDDSYARLPVQKQVDTALHSILIVAGALVVLILAAVAVIVYRKAFTASPAEIPESPADPLTEAAAEEQRGNFSAAAARYEAGGEKIKAAECWEKIKDFARAAECWEAGGDLERAAQLHVRSGSALRAAGIYMRTNNYIEAAKIFRNKGDHLRAAQALELYGNKIAAAREYAAAGNHANAARLLEQERMYPEAVEAYRPLLGGEEITDANADHFGTYAALLALAGEREQAVTICRRILHAVPGHQRAIAGLRKLQPRRPAEPAVDADAAPRSAPPPDNAPSREPETDRRKPETADSEVVTDAAVDQVAPLRRVFTLRSMMQAGRMEPRYCMRLWVQVMRTLSERHGANMVVGCLTPDAIVIDMENNISIGNPAGCISAYLSPEVQAGSPPDRQADIYSMGVILYELVAGSLEQFGRKRAGERFSDVPSWLDELIEHCTEKDLAKRYRTTEEVSAALLKLKSATLE